MPATQDIPSPDLVVRRVPFSDLGGWQSDDHAKALAVFRATSPDLAPELADNAAAREFFEGTFTPVLISDDKPALFTGYFEPELRGALQGSERFLVPLYAAPVDVKTDVPWLTRQQIEETRALAGREIAWIASELDAFLLQVQGSGRILLDDGTVVRLGYAGKNGHPYQSIGAELVRRGALDAETVSVRGIRDWAERHPDQVRDLLWHNPSFVFFKRLDAVDPNAGPIGTMGVSVTPDRTIAVDPDFVPMGAPVWIDVAGRDPIRRLMVAQDTGSAIVGPQRADIFFGSGLGAEQRAGQFHASGRQIVLLRNDEAERLLRGHAK